jgi:anthranilate phosphoribosyltransferase
LPLLNEKYCCRVESSSDRKSANAAAALVAAGAAADLRDGVKVAGRAIDSGAAMAKLEELRKLSTTP